MPDLTAKKKRPLWYNLSPLNLPLPGLVSILHRVSGVVLFLVVWPRPMSYAGWKALFAQGWMRFATFLLVASVLIHAWIGMRNVWMDYVKHTGLRLALEVATILWLVGCAGWAMQILWRI